MNTAALSLSVALHFGAILMVRSANAEILNYECAVGQVRITLRVDTALLEVTETTQGRWCGTINPAGAPICPNGRSENSVWSGAEG
jgi:hypothetical protein